MRSGVSDGHAELPAQLSRLIVERAVDGQDRDFLERDDVGLEVREDRADPLQAVAADVPPPCGRKWLAGTDRRADVPGDDPQARRPGRRARHDRCAFVT